MEKYLAEAIAALNKINETQRENIERAAEAVAATIEKDGVVYLFGTGHSHMIALEAYSRAGGLAPMKPLLEDNLMLHQGAFKSGALERLEGYAVALLAISEISKKDCMIVISNSGRNAAPVEMAMEAVKRGVTTIAVTSLSHSRDVTSRHSSGKRLFEAADIVIDNAAPTGDASTPVTGAGVSMGPISTITGAFIINSINLLAAEKLSAKGIKPPVFLSANAHDSEVHNIGLIQKYRNRIKF